MARKLALVTGASAGIGAAFARLLAARGYDLALSARRTERLEGLAAELAGRHGVSMLLAPADLALPEGPEQVLAAIAREGREIDVLINNAGYGHPGFYAASDWPAHQAFLQVMVTAPCELARKVLPGMLVRRYGRIVNVASLAGQIPPAAGHTLYAGSKALMIKFSESLHLETKGTGVHVTALCPGLTYSEFHDVNGSRERVRTGTPAWIWMRAEPVVEAGWRAVEANRPLLTPGAINRAVAAVARLVPDQLALKVIDAAGPRFGRPGRAA